MELCDIGVNLTDPVFRGMYRGKQRHMDDLREVIERATQSGVSRMIITGGSLAESREALGLAKESNALFSTVGVHPTRCNEFLHQSAVDAGMEAASSALMDAGAEDLIQAHLDHLLCLARKGMLEKKVVAIGEVGLDYERLEFCEKNVQLRCFEAQLR